MTKTIVDQEARDRIKTVLNQNFLVEAGAGSGKTTSLVERMVQLIYTGTCTIDQIVAITFTRKAADELKMRFQTDLEKAWQIETSVCHQQRLEAAIQNMEQCFLGTVHSFCARLLRERPVEAHLDLSFQELEDKEDGLVAEEAWQNYLLFLHENNNQSLQTIKDLGVEENTLLERFQLLKTYPDVEWVSESVQEPELSETYHSFIHLLKEARLAIPNDHPSGPDEMQKAIHEALRKNDRRKREAALYIEVFELFEKKKSYTITQYKWKSKEDAKEFKVRIQQFFEDRIKALLQQWREYCHPIITELLQGALREYETIKKERSLLNFQDLLMKTASLLKHNPEVRMYFQNKYRHLLVDEFQDTDPVQAEMMFYLTGEDVSVKNWAECKPRAGSLFVVGDPKQAIYRFRRADIDIYNLVKSLIKKHDGDVLQLTMNFRTLDTITSKLNQIFIHQLPEEETAYQAAYRPLDSFHIDNHDSFSGIYQLTVPKEFSKNKQDIVDKDAENIANSIQTLLNQGRKPKDFMIITRYTEGIELYAKRLEQLGIPVSVSGEAIIGSVREFQELFILLYSLVDTTDQVATVGVLRSLWFGISDEDLYQWKRGGGSFSINANIPKDLAENAIAIAFSKLQMYLKWSKEYSPVVTIEKIAEDVGFYPLLLKRSYRKREYTQFLQLIEAVRREEVNGKSSYHDTVAFLENTLKAKLKVINMDEDINAVRIMNVHKAKGLEASIVFLAHPGKKTDISNKIDSHIKREGQISKGFFKFEQKVSFSAKTIAQPSNWDGYCQEELTYLLQEEVRILYVAATRAEKALIISLCDGKDGKNPWRMLLEGIRDISNLEIESKDDNSNFANNEVETITIEKFNEATKDLFSWIDESAKPSYTKITPTEDKQEIHTLGIEREEGGGMAWGLAMHEVFEKFVNRKLTNDTIITCLKRHRLSVEREIEIKEAIERFSETKIWLEIQAAETVLCEVPFTVQINPNEPLYDQLKKNKSSEEPILLNGTIDLVYKFDGEWKIVDYKTDRPKDVDVLPDLANYYRDQIMLYSRVWENITREKVSEAQLYFVSPNKVMLINT